MDNAAIKRKPPKRAQYNFGRLDKRGMYIFIPGNVRGEPIDALVHRVRQATISYMKHHPKIKKAGHKLSTHKETASSVSGVKDGTPGAGVYRVAIDE